MINPSPQSHFLLIFFFWVGGFSYWKTPMLSTVVLMGPNCTSWKVPVTISCFSHNFAFLLGLFILLFIYSLKCMSIMNLDALYTPSPTFQSSPIASPLYLHIIKSSCKFLINWFICFYPKQLRLPFWCMAVESSEGLGVGDISPIARLLKTIYCLSTSSHQLPIAKGKALFQPR